MNIRRKVIDFIKEKIIAIMCIILVVFSNMTFYGNVVTECKNINSNANIDDNLEEIEAMKIEEMDKLEWEQDINAKIGTITLSANGKEVKMEGNHTLPGKNAIYIIPQNHQEQTLQFTYNIDYGDSFIAAGVLLNVKKEVYQDETGVNKARLKGYMLSFNNPLKNYHIEANSNGAIWTFTYELNDNESNEIQRTFVKALNIPIIGQMTIISNIEQIIINGKKEDGTASVEETIDIDENAEVGDGFGFFSVHYSHNCYEMGSFALKNCVFTSIDLLPHNLYVDPNGGKWENSSEVSTITGIYQDTREIPLPVRDGYTFVGWTKVGESGTMSSLTENAVYTFGEDEETDDRITAQWIKIDASKQINVTTGKVVEN